MTEDTLIALIIMGFSSLITLFCVGISQFKSITLRKEQIKADAMVRAEEIKCRNQIELEKLLRQDQQNQKITNTQDQLIGSDETRVVREKINI